MLKDIRELPKILDGSRDFADLTVEECLCGSGLFFVLATFHESEIGGYYSEMVCAACGSWYKAPMILD